VEAAVSLKQSAMVVQEFKASRVSRWAIVRAWLADFAPSYRRRTQGARWSTELTRELLLQSGAFRPDDLLTAVLQSMHPKSSDDDDDGGKDYSTKVAAALAALLEIDASQLVFRVVTTQLPELVDQVFYNSSLSFGLTSQHYQSLIEQLVAANAPLSSVCSFINTYSTDPSQMNVTHQALLAQFGALLTQQQQHGDTARRNYLFGVAYALVRQSVLTRRSGDVLPVVLECGVNLWKFAAVQQASVDIVLDNRDKIYDHYTLMIVRNANAGWPYVKPIPIEWFVEMVVWLLGGVEQTPSGLAPPQRLSIANRLLSGPFPATQIGELALLQLARTGSLTYSALRVLVLRPSFSNVGFDRLWGKEQHVRDAHVRGRPDQSIGEIVHELLGYSADAEETHQLVMRQQQQ
jgi:hypothetical protein